MIVTVQIRDVRQALHAVWEGDGPLNCLPIITSAGTHLHVCVCVRVCENQLRML